MFFLCFFGQQLALSDILEPSHADYAYIIMRTTFNDGKSADPLVAEHILAQFRKLQAFLEKSSLTQCSNSEKLGVVRTSSSSTMRSSTGCAMLIHKHETGRRNTSNKRTNDTLMPRRPSYLSTKTGSRERLSSSYDLPSANEVQVASAFNDVQVSLTALSFS
jgi:hypothetical protein